MRVGFDLDGVLYDFGECVNRYLQHIGQGHLYKSGGPAHWHFYEDWGWDGKQFVDFCNAGADAGFIFTGPARPNAAESVRKVEAMGHEIIIITDRTFGSNPKVSETHTLEWLAQHNIPYNEIHFSPNKTIVPTDIFVEDKPENYVDLAVAGVKPWMVNRNWNKSFPAKNRISDISEYPAKVEEHASWLTKIKN